MTRSTAAYHYRYTVKSINNFNSTDMLDICQTLKNVKQINLLTWVHVRFALYNNACAFSELHVHCFYSNISIFTSYSIE